MLVTITPTTGSVEGDNMTLTCNSQGGPGNTFLWTRSSDNTFVANTEILTISFIAANGGVYRCEVTNAAGIDSSTANFNGELCQSALTIVYRDKL